MAKYLTEEEVAKMENQAKLSQRMAAAQRELDPERQRRDQWHADNAAARGRRLDAMGEVARRDPGRYNPLVAKAAREELDRVESNRRFDEEDSTRIIESVNKREGMINQGKGAAEANAAAAMEESKNKWGYRGADGNWVSGGMERQEQIKADAQKEMAGIEGQTKRDVAGIQAKSQESIVNTQTQSQEKIEEQRNQNEIAKMTLTNMQRLQQNEHEMNKLHTEIGASMDQAEFKGLVTTINNLLTGDQMKGQKPMTIAQLREQYKDNPVAMKLLGKMAEAKTGLAGDAI